MNQFFSNEGRLRRLPYFVIITALYGVQKLLIGVLTNPNGPHTVLDNALLFTLLVAVVTVILLQVLKRLHDMNHSGWYSLLMLIPIFNLALGLFLTFRKGTDGANRFGPEPATPGGLFWLSGLVLLGAAWGYMFLPHNTYSQLAKVPRDVEVKLFPFRQNGKWGYIDSNGQVVITPRFRQASIFSEGLARVDEGLIDSEGHVVLDAKDLARNKMAFAGDFVDGKIAISQDDILLMKPGQSSPSRNPMLSFGFMDRSGRITRSPAPGDMPPIEGDERFHAPQGPGHFVDGLAPMAQLVPGRYLWGYIDHAGTYVIPAQFDAAEDFSEGLAAVKQGDFWGFINQKGTWVILPTLKDKPGKFRMGLVQVQQGNDIGYMDKLGHPVLIHL